MVSLNHNCSNQRVSSEYGSLIVLATLILSIYYGPQLSEDHRELDLI